MKNIAIVLVVAIFVIGAYFVYKTNVTNLAEEVQEVQNELAVENSPPETPVAQQNVSDRLNTGPSIQPISHASMVLTWDELTIYVDPVGDIETYTDMLAPNIVLVTDIHGDHFNVDTLEGIVAGDSVLVVPQVVYDALPESLAVQAVVMANDDTSEQQGLMVTAVPMYNVPESEDSHHVKGRGNGYVIEKNETRVYIAGDTGPTPEMRRLTDIDTAFVPMNLPYTMSVEQAADAVVEFAPKVAIPYHYRGPDGLSDVQQFKGIVELRSPTTKVLLLDWYPAEAEESD